MDYIFYIIFDYIFNFLLDITPDFISDITPDGWIALFGIIGGFVGVYKTIKNSEKQFKDEKRISIKPYLDIKLKGFCENENSFGIFKIGEFKKSNIYAPGNIGLEFTNLGLGNCLECKLVKVIIDDKNVNDEYGYIGNIKVDEKIIREITFKTWYENDLDKIKKEYIGKNKEDCPKEFGDGTYTRLLKKVELQFEYKDVLDNKYSKNIVIEVFINVNILAEKYIWEVSDIKFNDIYFIINGNLTSEELI